MATTALATYTPEEQQTIQLLGLPTNHVHTRALLVLARQYELDPVLKEIVLIPGRGPYIGVHGHLNIAHRSGLLDGIEADDEWETADHYCHRATVWRKDMKHPMKAVGRVGKWEKDEKQWPREIARARAVRAALGYAFNIHDSYGADDEDQAPGPDEYVEATEVPAAPAPSGSPGEDGGGREEGRAGPVDEDSHGNGEVAEIIDDGPLTLAQQIAKAAREAGIQDDQTRWDVVTAATDGRAKRGKDVIDPDASRVLEAMKGLAAGTVELRYQEDGTPRLFRIRRRPSS
jgi:hypothetical protein